MAAVSACPWRGGHAPPSGYAAVTWPPAQTLASRTMSIYDQHLDRNPANHVALSPVSFVERSAEVFADLPAGVHGARRYSWQQTRDRSARLAAALRALGVGRGSTVSVMLPNT